MKSFIENINKSLLEKFPLIWMTRAVWMLLITLVIHLLFFILGFNVFKDVELFREYYADRLYLHNGMLLFSIVCSVLTIVIWLIVLFRHNSFVHFYPTSRWQLFVSFLIYLLIFLLATSFYISYKWGYTTYVTNKYPDSKIDAQVTTGNLAAAFLPYNDDEYSIANKHYPAPFDTLYCETNEDEIDFGKPYLQRFNDEYQFYSLKKKLVRTVSYDGISTEIEGCLFERYISDSLKLCWNKNNVVDVSIHADTTLSYLNYSKIQFYKNGASRYYGIAYEKEKELAGGPDKVRAAAEMNEKVFKLLNENDKGKLKNLFTSFLAIAKEYKIETNLTADKWMNLVNTSNFHVEQFIRQYPPSNTQDIIAARNEPASVVDAVNGETTRDTPENTNKKLKYFEDRLTDYYLDADTLATCFQSISSIKYDYEWGGLILLQCWLAFGLAILLFMFRTSGLQALLLSLISGIILAILVTMLMMAMRMKDDFVVSYTAFVIGTAILLTPILLMKQVRKKVQIIFINITLAGIVPYLFLILAIINLHQEQYYKHLLGDDYYKKRPTLLLDYFGETWSYVLLIAGIIFVGFYTAVIKKWKALPES